MKTKDNEAPEPYRPYTTAELKDKHPQCIKRDEAQVCTARAYNRLIITSRLGALVMDNTELLDGITAALVADRAFLSDSIEDDALLLWIKDLRAATRAEEPVQ